MRTNPTTSNPEVSIREKKKPGTYRPNHWLLLTELDVINQTLCVPSIEVNHM
jgi:hypothetical protein